MILLQYRLMAVKQKDLLYFRFGTGLLEVWLPSFNGMLGVGGVGKRLVHLLLFPSYGSLLEAILPKIV